MTANATQDRYTPIQGAFAPQIVVSCQTRKGAAYFCSEYVGMI